MTDERAREGSRSGRATNILRTLYRQASEQGLFITEFTVPNGYLAAVGDRAPLKTAGIDPDKLGEADLLLLSAPGIGRTRTAAVQKALNNWRQHKIKQASTDT